LASGFGHGAAAKFLNYHQLCGEAPGSGWKERVAGLIAMVEN
jgi:hypothetical protein